MATISNEAAHLAAEGSSAHQNQQPQAPKNRGLIMRSYMSTYCDELQVRYKSASQFYEKRNDFAPIIKVGMFAPLTIKQTNTQRFLKSVTDALSQIESHFKTIALVEKKKKEGELPSSSELASPEEIRVLHDLKQKFTLLQSELQELADSEQKGKAASTSDADDVSAHMAPV